MYTQQVHVPTHIVIFWESTSLPADAAQQIHQSDGGKG